MDTLIAIGNVLVANIDTILIAVVAIIGGLVVIAKITKTTKDDEILERALEIALKAQAILDGLKDKQAKEANDETSIKSE